MIPTPWLYLIAAGVGAAVALTGANWKYGGEIARLQRDAAITLATNVGVVAAQLAVQQEASAALSAKLDAQDAKYFKELSDVKSAADVRIASLLSGSSRLSVKVANPVCPGGLPEAPGAGRVDDGSYTAELLPADAATIYRISEDADSCAVKLSALQDWARGVSR